MLCTNAACKRLIPHHCKTCHISPFSFSSSFFFCLVVLLHLLVAPVFPPLPVTTPYPIPPTLIRFHNPTPLSCLALCPKRGVRPVREPFSILEKGLRNPFWVGSNEWPAALPSALPSPDARIHVEQSKDKLNARCLLDTTVHTHTHTLSLSLSLFFFPLLAGYVCLTGLTSFIESIVYILITTQLPRPRKAEQDLLWVQYTVTSNTCTNMDSRNHQHQHPFLQKAPFDDHTTPTKHNTTLVVTRLSPSASFFFF
ncbi:hypothetical protein BD289DRAFT_209791 [Coniella lustricola]|uniref:Uncharacterized protein n=1 Tax=Coniella lustricola TaxID=2025994 RepID=A0A2T2ZS79_9PEZI|nr:hypothetical protein BD289DRAFT_209791 [Coniella lustricola]